MVKYGFLHCHTQNSVKDSVMTVKDFVREPKKWRLRQWLLPIMAY